MHFTGTKHLHEIENIMQEIPNFLPKGHGGTVLKKEMEDCIRGRSEERRVGKECT